MKKRVPIIDTALLDQLEDTRRRFGGESGVRMARLLSRLQGRRLGDAASLIRLHETLLFIRAYPHNAEVLNLAEELLVTFHKRVEELRRLGADSLDGLAQPEVSGIAGTTLSIDWGYDVVRHLAARHPTRADIDWEGFEQEGPLVSVMKSLLPLFEDGAYAEYPIPYREWIRAAKPKNETDLIWLLKRFEALALPEAEKGVLFESLKLSIRWKLGNSLATRTRLRVPARRIFFHEGPLVTRRDVSLDREIEGSAGLPVRKLSRALADRLLAKARDAMTIRCRELHGFTYGDERHVYGARAGRGVEFFIWGVPPMRRLPLLAYHALLIAKNGVPIGYAEALSLFERSEVGLNIFYTFRDGEAAWIYARLLRFLRQFLGVTVFSIDPYQIGFHNDEAIESAAFWFYRKLGFRPVKTELMKLTSREERRIANRPGYRTPARVLRKLATGHLLYEAPSTLSPGDWDGFHVRNVGIAVQRHVAEQFDGDVERFKTRSLTRLSKVLGRDPSSMNDAERRVFSDIAMVLSVIPGSKDWSIEELRAMDRIARAKSGTEEVGYLRLLQGHRKFRDVVRCLG